MENNSIFKNPQFLLGLTSGIAVVSLLGMVMMGMALVKGGSVGAVAGDSIFGGGAPNAPAPTKGVVDLKVAKDDHVRGAKNAKITLIEWSDFQCPFCSRFNETVEQVLQAYPNDVQVVYRHFPLDSIHPAARPAAEASECANDQGKFWEYHDALFASQQSLSGGVTFLKAVAGQIGLDQKKFDSCVDDRKHAQKVEQQYQDGIAAGIQGTPGSFLNGQELGGAVPFDSLKPQIDALLK